MIVIDASAMVEALVGREVDDALLDAMKHDVAAPHLLDIEVLSALRRLVLSGKLASEAADVARADHFDLQIVRHETAPLADRIWELRHRYSAYDAAYLALAEGLEVPLHTCDAKLDRGGHHATVYLHSRTS